MASHEVNILSFTERPANYTQRTDSTVGLIEVKPPITVGGEFGAVVLGRDQWEISLKEVGSTVNSTIFWLNLDAMVQIKKQDSLTYELLVIGY